MTEFAVNDKLGEMVGLLKKAAADQGQIIRVLESLIEGRDLDEHGQTALLETADWVTAFTDMLNHIEQDDGLSDEVLFDLANQHEERFWEQLNLAESKLTYYLTGYDYEETEETE